MVAFLLKMNRITTLQPWRAGKAVSFFCLNAPSSVRVLDKKWMKCIIIHVKCIIIDYMHNRKGMTSMKKVFIDGSAGTTGLRIVQRLSERKDIELISIPEELRKDTSARKDTLNKADIVFLCLPDDAAREAVSLIENPDVCVIDTSTAHRTAEGWTYGFAEIGNRYDEIKASKRIANPGCHASGFISLVAPLVECGILKKDSLLSAYSLTGYSGGGKKMIAQYDDPARSKLLDAPRMYGLTQKHKHLPEMAAICHLDNDPVFCPVVAPYYSGMQVTVPLFKEMASCSIDEIKNTDKS